MESAAQALTGLSVSKTKELKGTEKRDHLVAWEKECQESWANNHVFETEPPSIDEIPLHSISAEELREKDPKWFGCMAYPYMNGTLHAGHSFSVSKVEFAAGVARMQGKRALFPMGFHCTGMPIKACADKLVNEIEMFGQEFERYNEEDEKAAEPAPAAKPAATKTDPTKFSAKKGKANAKTIKSKYQFQIMRSIGIPNEEIHHFSEPRHWIDFFSPLAQRDLQSIGCRIDWRRSFVTTDVNPYYDSFIRWQMRTLKDLGKIKFGKRYTVYSIKDGQPCLDHDRSVGEAVNPQEYTAIKLKVLEWAPTAAEALKDKIPEGVNVFLVPATLRPETMYGQTCCFVGPKLSYGIFKASDKEYYVMTERAARNMAYQGIFSEEGVITKVADLKGSDMIGTLIHAPLSMHESVYVLPMETVLATKGTGVVTSVPSDSPDDYATVTDLAKKPEFYGIQKEWAEKEIFPIIQTPSYTDLCAPFLVKQLKISSPKDTIQLEKAKELAYKEGFYQGVLKVGEFKGEKVEDAKPKIRAKLISAGEAFVYSEPESRVVSRSGDECIVALLDQWFLEYGEKTWKDTAMSWVNDGMNSYAPETKHAFIGVLDWLKDWAVSRNFGLGTKLPWDQKVLVESLSDSTIYMAYYTQVPFLHSDIFGKVKGPANIAPEQMVDEVWDYVFCRRDLDDKVLSASNIPKHTLEAMRRSFEYFYPLDVRASGKDLVPNHLTFMIYTHLAIFPKEYWPRAVRANGHLMLNGEKMSKSTGNFLTLHELAQKYGADAARIALADAGDGINDANFEEDTADTAIIRLYNLREWCEEMVEKKKDLRTGEFNDYQDQLFINEINTVAAEAVHQYEQTNYKLALKAAFYEFLSARDFYRESCNAASIPMHAGLIERWMRTFALIIAPIASHFAEFIWLKILNEKTTIQNARFPKLDPSSPSLTAARDYVRVTSSSVNSAEQAQIKRKAKGKEVLFDPKKPKHLIIYMNAKFPEWQDKYIALFKEMWDPKTKTIDEKSLKAKIGKMGEMKKAMPFVQSLKFRLVAGEPEEVVLDRKLAFDEKKLLQQMVPGLKRAAGLVAVTLVEVQGDGKKGINVADGTEVETVQIAENATPGSPSYYLTNIEA